MMISNVNKKYFAELEVAKKLEFCNLYASNRELRKILVKKLKLKDDNYIRNFWRLTESVLISSLISDSIKLLSLNSFTSPGIDFYDFYNELLIDTASVALDNAKLLGLIDSEETPSNYESFLGGIYKNIKIKIYNKYNKNSKYKYNEILYNYADKAFEELIQKNKEKHEFKIESNLDELSDFVIKIIKNMKNQNRRDVLILWYEKKMNINKICEILNLKYNTVVGHIHRGKEEIRKKYKNI
jgi:DNA-directed RNA polymerase specialized sigma24 family protein